MEESKYRRKHESSITLQIFLNVISRWFLVLPLFGPRRMLWPILNHDQIEFADSDFYLYR